ncbi:SDR family NAD(P)-dependent oxidoreductase [Flavisphingomonas formosensis]|uniref:SDR family NAD(P)-dependent oxidoreductase n=1 Tax=Flavisphingomonas formosensis TaxID=861534 RepID=UPI0018DF851E|nr:SDR family NAD(P)-dependent oxidoreductase [Sphingomonas formosensis]
MDLQLTGKRAIVTGGSRGIGRAIARALLDEGVRVAIGEGVRAAAAVLTSEGGEAHGFAVDTRDDASVDGFVAAAAAALGGIDIVVNAAAQPASTAPTAGIAGVSSAGAGSSISAASTRGFPAISSGRSAMSASPP